MSRPGFRPLALTCALALLAVSACRDPGIVAAAPSEPAVSPPELAMVGAHLLDGLGDHHFPVTATHPESDIC